MRIPVRPLRGTTASATFEAKWAGTCQDDDCGRPFPVGALIKFSQHNRIVHADCSADPNERSETMRADDEPIPPRAVLPRNPQPACTKCFQIPSSNGVCGCL